MFIFLLYLLSTETKRSEDGYGMSRSSFASFHLTGIKPSSGKMMQSSVDRLFENDGDVFLSSNFNEFQVIILNSFNMIIIIIIVIFMI